MSSAAAAGARKQKKRGVGGGALQTLLPPADAAGGSTEQSSSDAFAHHLLKQTVAQILLSSEVQTIDSSSLDAVVEACKRKLLQLGGDLKQVSERAKRSQTTCEDFLQLPSSSSGVSDLMLTDLTFLGEIPSFPVQVALPDEAITTPTVTEEAAQTCGLAHLPPFPPAHTYKRTKLSEGTAMAETPSSIVNELRRVQQRHSALVREALAKMQRDTKKL
ncbi:hypothetical protein BASA81_007726 [Batrachochytrium salamandrivorans]|nr:hypothetical protein BASA81_007726 [Batrachochytrium salamandrivorans]